MLVNRGIVCVGSCVRSSSATIITPQENTINIHIDPCVVRLQHGSTLRCCVCSHLTALPQSVCPLVVLWAVCSGWVAGVARTFHTIIFIRIIMCILLDQLIICKYAICRIVASLAWLVAVLASLQCLHTVSHGLLNKSTCVLWTLSLAADTRESLWQPYVWGRCQAYSIVYSQLSPVTY